MEWIRFAATALFLGIGVLSFASAVLGTFRFDFIMNRIHAAGIGDTVALFSVVLASMIGTGDAMTILKLVLILVFMWCTSPVSTHFLGQIEYYMDTQLNSHVEREDRHESS